jgi:hypothetical protein
VWLEVFLSLGIDGSCVHTTSPNPCDYMPGHCGPVSWCSNQRLLVHCGTRCHILCELTNEIPVMT